MFAYLINLGFTEKQIVDYVRSTDYSLDQLLSDVNGQIDTAIRADELVNQAMDNIELNSDLIQKISIVFVI